MKMDESARTNKEVLYIYYFVVTKDKPKQGENPKA